MAGMLALAVTATVAGCRSFAAIGQWAAETAADKLALFGLTSGGVPDESTLRKLAPASMPTHSTVRWVCGCGPEPSSSASAA